ncbi:unnamed protein product [Mytilus coruscus]|uniref:Uncharacterized protein n=1 Tax=Mytilus coruscus TaxID=42192 RepID=A0A6J8CVG7_MYTCO|nr:unnamed protein product [Mytilus coruscus]
METSEKSGKCGMGNKVSKRSISNTSFSQLCKEDKNDKEAPGNCYSHLPKTEVKISNDDDSVKQTSRRDVSLQTLDTHCACCKYVQIGNGNRIINEGDDHFQLVYKRNSEEESDQSSGSEENAKKDEEINDLLFEVEINQYDMYQLYENEINRLFICKIMKCSSRDKIKTHITSLIKEMETYVDDKTKKNVKKFRKAVKKRPTNREESDSIVNSIKSNSVKLKTLFTEKLSTVQFKRENELKTSKGPSFNLNHDEIENGQLLAIVVYDIIAKRTTEFVKGLMPLKVQTYIIRHCFNFSKKKVMQEVQIGLMRRKVKHDLNGYAKHWLMKYTDKKLFCRRECRRLHLYAQFAKEEIELLFREIKICLDQTIKCSLTFVQFCNCFLQYDLPISYEDVSGLLQESGDKIDMISFTSVLLKQLDNIDVILDQFVSTDETNVMWVEDPYTKITEILWGCVHNCGICHEHFNS